MKPAADTHALWRGIYDVKRPRQRACVSATGFMCQRLLLMWVGLLFVFVFISTCYLVVCYVIYYIVYHYIAVIYYFLFFCLFRPSQNGHTPPPSGRVLSHYHSALFRVSYMQICICKFHVTAHPRSLRSLASGFRGRSWGSSRLPRSLALVLIPAVVLNHIFRGLA